MSNPTLDAFRSEVERDASLLSELQAQKTKADFVNKTVQLGASRGYTFTPDEVDAYLASVAPGQLSDDSLQSVAGGAQPIPLSYTYSRPGCN